MSHNLRNLFQVFQRFDDQIPKHYSTFDRLNVTELLTSIKTITKQNLSETKFKGRRSKFKSLIIDKNFEPENPKQLEELDESVCKWPIGHPDEKNFYFCGRTSLKDFSYCKLHLLYAYQPKGKKEDAVEKEEDMAMIGKKIKSA